MCIGQADVGCTAGNVSLATQNVGRTMRNAGHNMLNVCHGPHVWGLMCPLGPKGAPNPYT